jgi:hypothetical protein
MKQFLAQQRAEFKASKALFKKQLDEDLSLSGLQRKQILEERKRELLQQQKANENDHLHILKTTADQNKVEFRQKVMQDRHSFEKGLLEQVRKFVCSLDPRSTFLVWGF